MENGNWKLIHFWPNVNNSLCDGKEIQEEERERERERRRIWNAKENFLSCEKLLKCKVWFLLVGNVMVQYHQIQQYSSNVNLRLNKKTSAPKSEGRSAIYLYHYLFHYFRSVIISGSYTSTLQSEHLFCHCMQVALKSFKTAGITFNCKLIINSLLANFAFSLTLTSEFERQHHVS